MEQFVSFDANFWRDFVAQYWEQNTTKVSCPLELDPAEVFAAMLRAAEFERVNESCNFNDPYRIAVDGAHVLDADTFQALLPQAEDEDLDGFFNRLEAICDYDLGFQLTKVTAWSPRLWQQIRHFLQPFFQAAGVIPELIEVDVFFGKYSQTHFGVHRDADSIFTIGLLGGKQFRLWPADFFGPEATLEGWPNHIQPQYYQQHYNDADVVTVGQGDMAYWPNAVWHVGESPSSWSMTLAVALHLNPDPYERVKAIISNLLPTPPRSVDANAYPLDVLACAQKPPATAANLTNALTDIRSAMASDQIDMHLSLDWLKQVSGLGMTATPPPLTDMVAAEDLRLCISGPHVIQWQSFANNRHVIAANGYGDLFTLPDPAPMLLELNTGVAVTLGELLDRHGFNGDARLAATRLIENLMSWSVFEAVP